MLKIKVIILLCTSALLLISTGLMKSSYSLLYIRMNQVGFLPKDNKSAVILSATPLLDNSFYIKSEKNKEVIFSGKLKSCNALNENFQFSYSADFSSVNTQGKYELSVNGVNYKFEIGENIYNPVLSSLFTFFKAQRCGYTDAFYHSVCHPYDATSIIDDKDTIKQQYDVTGGWHDAGDYIKFLNTAAYTTYTLMFAYEFDPGKYGFDNNKNSVPDILEEAKIGLDWLLRLQYNNKFIVQVQDLRDHEQGWRKPDADLLAYDRPAFTGIGKNSIGIYCACMAAAARIWKSTVKYDEFSEKCLKSAMKFYVLKSSVPDVDKTQSGMYQDNKFNGKLALAAVELFLTTNNQQYLQEAFTYADSAKSDFWWSWGDINAFAHYKLAKINPRFKNYITSSLEHLRKISTEKLFGESAGDSWGSNTALLGAALQAILLNDLDPQYNFQDFLNIQRDFIFGRNQWGVSFINGAGNNYSKNFHSQLAYFNNGILPGAVAAGPISKSKFEKYKIKLTKPDILSEFQTDEAVYHDDRADWLTNEPTITSNATALFVVGFFVKKSGI